MICNKCKQMIESGLYCDECFDALVNEETKSVSDVIKEVDEIVYGKHDTMTDNKLVTLLKALGENIIKQADDMAQQNVNNLSKITVYSALSSDDLMPIVNVSCEYAIKTT